METETNIIKLVDSSKSHLNKVLTNEIEQLEDLFRKSDNQLYLQNQINDMIYLLKQTRLRYEFL